jgi:uncharacterized protein (DUF1501 family)
MATHAKLLRELGASLRAFLDDLENSGESERVVVLVFSEFGRRLAENGSAGTDHGTAAPVLLLGRPVKGGLYGPHPDLTHLEDGNPRHAVDFRRIYATLLQDWLNVSVSEVLGARFEAMPLLGESRPNLSGSTGLVGRSELPPLASRGLGYGGPHDPADRG